MVRAEDVVFWILILAIIGIVIWQAFGSPDFESSLLSIAIFVAISEIILWKALFGLDKKASVRFSVSDKRTAVGFERVRSDFKIVNNRLSNIENNIKEIKDKVVGRKK